MSFFRAYITFPEGSTLTISRHPNAVSTDTYIQAVSDSVGTYKFLAASIDFVREKLALYPNAYKKDGIVKKFEHIYFPGGVYKIEYVLRESSGSLLVQTIEPVLNTVYIDTVLKEASEYISMLKCEQCPSEVEEILEMTSIIMALRYSAGLKFQENEFKKANIHIASAERYAHKVMDCLKRLKYV